MPFVRRSFFTSIPPLRLIRYALSGALIGVAAAGIYTWVAGVPQREVHDIVGASAGFYHRSFNKGATRRVTATHDIGDFGNRYRYD
jgi:hypothetical protein